MGNECGIPSQLVDLDLGWKSVEEDESKSRESLSRRRRKILKDLDNAQVEDILQLSEAASIKHIHEVRKDERERVASFTSVKMNRHQASQHRWHKN